MDFKNRRMITAGVDLMVNPLLQIFMWHCIDTMPKPKDYLQVFTCSGFDGKQKITHIQEEPEYKREYLLQTDAPILLYRKLRSYKVKRIECPCEIFRRWRKRTWTARKRYATPSRRVRRSRFLVGKIFVIDDETHSTMLLAEEKNGGAV